ncbi:hypothetical protein N658DRAFT_559257 [Parathielavia hyrcaniae]|uniref:Uncharacterized protein n=1 Tax=Parathielavia hyrcaniae TaxID=113614 RepID=A0AAN6Q022_9PEZI|nr:hypothetical protein N658DRAFT_559257 [Parathielavia hyrcaniae]
MDGTRRVAGTAGTDCECYINTAEIKQGSWQEDPSHCLRNCKTQFLRSVLNGWEDDVGWAEGCRRLNRSVPLDEFWPLYWCDSTFCGVWIDPAGGLQQDRTADISGSAVYIIASDVCQQHGSCNHDDGTTKAQPGHCISRADIFISCVYTERNASSSTVNNVRKKRRKDSFHRALRSRRGVLSNGLAPAGSPTPLISPASSTAGTRALVTPPLRLRDRKFLPSLLRPGSRSPSPPLTPLTPAYSPQPGGRGGGAVFPSSPICSPTTSKLVPRHERTLTPRNHPAYSSGGNSSPSRLSPSSMTPESAFSLPVPVPGSASGLWPGPRSAGDGQQQQQQQQQQHPYHHYHHPQQPPHRGSASASSCYTGQTGTSTAHSSLRHEIPIATPFFMNGTNTGTNTGTGTPTSSTNTPPPPPPPPATPASPSLPGSSLPSRPPRPHESMLQIPDLLTPAPTATSTAPSLSSSSAGGGGVGGGGIVPTAANRAGRVGSVSTPPPLSPPPTRALPRPPPPATPPPPILHAPAAAPVRGGGGDKVLAAAAGAATPMAVPAGPLPPPNPLGRAVSGAGEGNLGISISSSSVHVGGGGKSSPSPPLPPPPPPPLPPSRFGGSSVSVAGQHQQDYGRPPPAYSFVAAGDGRKERVLSRGSWGSWSAAGTVVGGGSFVAGDISNTGAGAGAGAGGLTRTEIREEGKGGGEGDGEAVSPVTSEGGDGAAVTGAKTVPGASGMLSMGDGAIGGRV